MKLGFTLTFALLSLASSFGFAAEQGCKLSVEQIQTTYHNLNGDAVSKSNPYDVSGNVLQTLESRGFEVSKSATDVDFKMKRKSTVARSRSGDPSFQRRPHAKQSFPSSAAAARQRSSTRLRQWRIPSAW